MISLTRREVLSLTSLGLLSCTVAEQPEPRATRTGSALDFRNLIPGKAPRSAIFRLPDHHVWGASMARTDDGVCRLLFSRRPRSLGFDAWATHCEIAYATADRPEGPYRLQRPVLPTRGWKEWDGHGTHNPCIIEHDGKFFLYFAGQRGSESWRPDRIATKEEWWAHRSNQRVGVAVAPHPSGPWRRLDKPLIDATPEYGHGITWEQSTNALVTKFRLRWDDRSEQTFSRLEMPKLHLENGPPRVLFLAARPDDDLASLSLNVADPLAHPTSSTTRKESA